MPLNNLHPVRKLIILGSVLLILLAVQPFLWRYVETSTEALRMKQSEKTQYQSIGSNLDKVKSTIAEQEQALEELSVVFPKKDNTSQVVGRLERLADDNGIDFQIKSILEKEVDASGQKLPGLTPLQVTLEASGDPVHLLQYLEATEHVPEVATIDSWSLQKSTVTDSATGQQTTQYGLVAQVTFYILTDI